MIIPRCRQALTTARAGCGRRWSARVAQTQVASAGSAAVVPNVRPTNGEGAAAWIKQSIEEYFNTSQGNTVYRSQAAFALRQMDDRFSFLKPDTVVVDLGCFSGGWSQVAVERTFPSSSSSMVIGVDVVQMDLLDDYTFIQGDVADDATLEKILTELRDRRADVVLSDLLPPTIGLPLEDHLASMQCCLHAGRIMEKTLRRGGWFVCKLLAGRETSNWRTYLDSRFETVRSIKPPPASRQNHREFFTVCRGFKGRASIAGEVLGPAEDIVKHEGVDKWDIRQRRGE